MRKIFCLFILLSLIFNVTGCNNKNNSIKNEIINITATDDYIIIDTTNITDVATLYNYEVDGVVIQIIVVRHHDGTIGVAFNSCEACNSSPNGYFLQDGDYFVCQNCGTKVSVDDIGIISGDCNPFKADDLIEENNTIKMTKEYVESFKKYFENWNGLTK